jgi:hypothetical protein
LSHISGITAHRLTGVTKTLLDVQKELSALLFEDTIGREGVGSGKFDKRAYSPS